MWWQRITIPTMACVLCLLLAGMFWIDGFSVGAVVVCVIGAAASIAYGAYDAFIA